MEEYEKKVAEEENDLVEVKNSEVINSKKRKLQDEEPEEIIQEIIEIKTTNFLLVQFSQLDCDWSMEYK